MVKKKASDVSPILNYKYIIGVVFVLLLFLAVISFYPYIRDAASGDLAGQAPKGGKKQLADGCYIKVGSENHRVSIDSKYCESLFIALYFIDNNDNALDFKKKDFYLLLHSMGLKFTESQITQNDLKVFNRKGDYNDDFSSVSKLFSSSSCQTLNYFGVNLYCFNQITGEKTKPNNLKYVIRDFTFLKYTNAKIHNPMRNKKVNPFGFVVNSGATYYDGSYGSFYGLTVDQTRCTGPRANYNAPNNRVYLCIQMFDQERKKYENAGVLYHEVNHRCSNGEFCGQHITCPFDCQQKTSSDLNLTGARGAQLFYLNEVAGMDSLPPNVRCGAYSAMMKELDTKICHCQNTLISCARPDICLRVTPPTSCPIYSSQSFTCAGCGAEKGLPVDDDE